MILVFYPGLDPHIKRVTHDRAKRVDQLIQKVDALRTSYNYQLEVLRDEYYPKINDAVNEIKLLVN